MHNLLTKKVLYRLEQEYLTSLVEYIDLSNKIEKQASCSSLYWEIKFLLESKKL